MKHTVTLSSQEYLDYMQNRLGSRLAFGQERFIGFCFGMFFSVCYLSGEEFGRRNYPIQNKAMGFVTTKNGTTTVFYHIFRGLTDPLSVLLLFLGTLFIFVILETPYATFFAVAWTGAAALLTFCCTLCSEVGQDGTERLEQFLNGRRVP